MATREEKIILASLGCVAGIVYAYNRTKEKDISEADFWRYIIGFGIGGGLIGYLVAIIFGTPSDTVNYELINRKKSVYHGITYKNRVDLRKREHIRNGKLFTEMKVGKPKPRNEALKLEKILIKQHKPIYNIQHNA